MLMMFVITGEKDSVYVEVIAIDVLTGLKVFLKIIS